MYVTNSSPHILHLRLRHNPHTLPRLHLHVFHPRRMNLSVTVFANRRQVRRMVLMDMSDEVVRVGALLML